MRKYLLSILSIIIIIAFITGCNSNKGSGKTLIYGSATDYSRINPALDEHGEIHKIIFSGLTKHDENNKVIPDLAKSWNFNKEELSYTFILREDVKWHDGTQFNSEDVKYTIEAIKNPKNNSEISTNYKEITKVEIIDDYKVKIYLNKPFPPILDYLSVGMLPKHILENEDINDSSFNQNPIGTGPYKLNKWEMGQYIKLKANENYYENVANIDTLVFKVIEDEKVRALQLKSGDIDLTQIEPKDMEIFKNNESIKLYKEKTADYRGIMYNFKNPIFENANVRKALTYAIDKEKIVDEVLNGMGEVAKSPLQMGPYNNENIKTYSFNPKRAKELLDKSGWIVGSDNIREKNGEKLSFNIVCFEGDPVRINIANSACQYFKNINVDANVKIKPKGSVKWSEIDSFLIGWGSPFDPDDHTYKVFHSTQADEGVNLNSYSNDKVDNLLEKARTTLDNNKRKKYYNKFQEEFAEDPPYSLIAYIDAVYGANKNITGINSRVLGHHGVGFLWNIEKWDIKK
ncbi:MAG: ABC transporter substrate-binding protein [Firmicutes bacterium]|nr:ABC transporter substrate-binding protein [Bacillota bacterium]